MKKKSVVQFCAVLLSIALVVSIYPTRGYAYCDDTKELKVKQYDTTFIDIFNSTFAPLVNSTPDPAVYPKTYEIETDPSFIIQGYYHDEVSIDMESAVNTSIDFLSSYLPEISRSNWSIGHTGEYWPGDPHILDSYLPRWAMTLVTDSIRVSIFVNALSGRVVDFNLYSYDDETYEGVEIPSTEEVEQIALDFLLLHDYTILPDAKYEGAIHTPSLGLSSNDYYTVAIQHWQDEIEIPLDYIHLEINSYSGLVTSFHYRWIDIDTIPLDQALTTTQAKSVVVNNYNDSTEVEVLDVDLILRLMNLMAEDLTFRFRLVYSVMAVDIRVVNYIVDAQSGEILEILLPLSGSSYLIYSPYVRSIMVLTLSIMASLFIFHTMRRRYSKG